MADTDRLPEFDPFDDETEESFFEESLAAQIAWAQRFPQAPPAVSPVYVGADGQSVVYLAARPVSQAYLGARSLF